MSAPIRDEHGMISEKDPNVNLKGWKRYFNSYTMRGRANIFYASVIGLYVGYRIVKSRTSAHNDKIFNHKSLQEYYDKKANGGKTVEG